MNKTFVEEQVLDGAYSNPTLSHSKSVQTSLKQTHRLTGVYGGHAGHRGEHERNKKRFKPCLRSKV